MIKPFPFLYPSSLKTIEKYYRKQFKTIHCENEKWEMIHDVLKLTLSHLLLPHHRPAHGWIDFTIHEETDGSAGFWKEEQKMFERKLVGNAFVAADDDDAV